MYQVKSMYFYHLPANLFNLSIKNVEQSWLLPSFIDINSSKNF